MLCWSWFNNNQWFKIISGVEADLCAVRGDAAVHIARSKVSEVLKSAKLKKMICISPKKLEGKNL